MSKTKKNYGVPVPEREIIVFLAQHNGESSGSVINKYAKVRWKISKTTSYKYLSLLEAQNLVKESPPSIYDVSGGNTYQLVGESLLDLSRLYLHLWKICDPENREMFAGRLRNSAWFDNKLTESLKIEDYFFITMKEAIMSATTDGLEDFTENVEKPEMEAFLGRKPKDGELEGDKTLRDIDKIVSDTYKERPRHLLKIMLDSGAYTSYLFFKLVCIVYGDEKDDDREFFKQVSQEARYGLVTKHPDDKELTELSLVVCIIDVLSRISRVHSGGQIPTKAKLRGIGLGFSLLMDSEVADQND